MFIIFSSFLIFSIILFYDYWYQYFWSFGRVIDTYVFHISHSSGWVPPGTSRCELGVESCPLALHFLFMCIHSIHCIVIFTLINISGIHLFYCTFVWYGWFSFSLYMLSMLPLAWCSCSPYPHPLFGEDHLFCIYIPGDPSGNCSGCMATGVIFIISYLP